MVGLGATNTLDFLQTCDEVPETFQADLWTVFICIDWLYPVFICIDWVYPSPSNSRK